VDSELNHAGHSDVIHCHDPDTGLRAIIAIHDVRLGRAMGATRLYPYASDQAALDDALRLRRGMTHKAACAGIPVGGAKGVIIADPRQKTERLLRSYGRFVDRLGGRFITGQDVNLDLADVAILRAETPHVVGTSRRDGGPAPVTARGVVLGMSAAVGARRGTGSLKDIRVAVQGTGNVGREVCRLLAERGARLVVADVEPGRSAAVAAEHGAVQVGPEDIYEADVDVFAPCALGAVLSAQTIPRLRAEIVAGAANNQLAEEDADAVRLKNRGILYCPDFVINAGGLIHVYQEFLGYEEQVVSRKLLGIAASLRVIFQEAVAERTTTAAAARRLAERRVAASVEEVIVQRSAGPGSGRHLAGERLQVS
jgi:leucine dehydrogenase